MTMASLLCFLALAPLLLFSTAVIPLSTAQSMNMNSTAAHAQSMNMNSTTATTHGATEYRDYIILLWLPTGPDASGMDAAAHRAWHETFLPTLRTDAGEPRLHFSYRFIFNGFAASLTKAELKTVSKKPGFLRSFPERRFHLLTTRTPGFLGLTKDAGVWRDTSYGKGVIIGVIDSGIYNDHPSLADHDMEAPPQKWKGSCQGGLRCNWKLIGAKTFLPGDQDASDHVGHGTHTATTAAGNFVEGVSLNSTGVGYGTASGIAPGAHLAVYKACNESGCDEKALLAGMDAAIDDGVDILSISLGVNIKPSFDRDPVAIGAFSAMEKGVVVVAAAGNDGPGASSVSNDAPWLTTVAAGSVDRSFQADLQLDDGRLLLGQSLGKRGSSSTTQEWSPLRYSNEDPTCESPGEEEFDDLIVVCDAVSDPDQQQRIVDNLLLSSDPTGVVLIDKEENGYSTELGDYRPRVVQIPNSNAGDLRKYATSKGSVGIVSLANERIDAAPAPIVASFSSRGPSLHSPGVLKPDILAPGLNILAGVPSEQPNAFMFMSGTSMAAPHVSGVAALVRSRHVDWSAAAVKSAILTTADTTGNNDGPLLDQHEKEASVYATGTGHVNATRAVDPGLVYDLGVSDYGSYICSVFGEGALRAISRKKTWSCSDLSKTPEAMLNYPSITVPLQPAPFTVRRTLTNVGPAGTYTVTVDMPASVKVTVVPETLYFGRLGQQASFTVTVSSNGASGSEQYVEGSLTWVSNFLWHRVRSPLVAVRDLHAAPRSEP